MQTELSKNYPVKVVPHRPAQIERGFHWFKTSLGLLDNSTTNSYSLNQGKSAILLLFDGIEVLSSASDKAKLFAKNFSKNINLYEKDISLPVFPSRTNLKLHKISVMAKIVKKVKMNLELSKASGPDCNLVVVLKN